MLTQLQNSTKDTTEEKSDQTLSRSTSRRGLLVGGLTAALGAATGIASAQNRLGGFSGGSMRSTPAGSKPPGTGVFVNNSGGAVSGGPNVYRSWGDVNKRLLRRISYGATQSDLANIDSIGYNAYLEKQLNYESIDDSACEARISSALPNYNMTVHQINQLGQANAYFGSEAAVGAMVIRSAKSERQLYQRMVEFMHDHFYVFAGTQLGHYLDFQREVIWKKSMGTFKDILTASANHGLMMLYLDNWLSSANRVNVNYARELLELHTVGVDAGYTEDDIYQVADVFTGWRMLDDQGNPDFLTFKYQDSKHATGTKVIMGQSFPQTGKAQGDAVLAWLASHPATIKNMADKLCMWFLGHPATSQILSEIFNVWGTDGDMKAVLRVILASSNMTQINPIFKRPFHLLVGAIRQAESDITSAYWVRAYLNDAGHSTGNWIQPNGFPNGFNYWSGGMVYRFRMMTHFSRGRLQYAPPIDDSIMTGMSDGQKMAFINDKFFLGELPVSDQIWIRRYLKGNTNHKQAIAISLCSPTYQWF